MEDQPPVASNIITAVSSKVITDGGRNYCIGVGDSDRAARSVTKILSRARIGADEPMLAQKIDNAETGINVFYARACAELRED